MNSLRFCDYSKTFLAVLAVVVLICANSGMSGAVPALEEESNSSRDGAATESSSNGAAASESNNLNVVEIATAWEQMLPVRADGQVILAMPGTNRDTKPLDERPVLPLDSDATPYPAENNPNIAKFLDDRTKDDRYLRKQPANVNPDNTLKDMAGVKSYFDHPNVQSRPHRSQHYRLNVGNVDNIPIPLMVDESQPLAMRKKSAREIRGAVYPTRSAEKVRFKTLPEIYARPNIFVTYVKTASGMYPEVDPFLRPPGTNMLPTVYQDMRDRKNNVMPNTLPSHPNSPYNLHDGEPVVTRLQTLSSPADDLRLILDEMFELITGIPKRRLWEDLDKPTLEELLLQATNHESQIRQNRKQLLRLSKWAIDMIEGNGGNESKVPSNRAYRGFPLLNHSGHKYRNNRAIPIYGEHGEIVSANIDVHQIWFGGRIQSDTMFFDFGWDDEPLVVQSNKGLQKRWYSTYDPHWKWELRDKQTNQGHVSEQDVAQLTQRPEPIPADVPWTVTYTIDVLSRGQDDFSPTQVYFDDLEPIQGTDKIPAYRVYNSETGKNEMTRFGPPHVAMDQTFFPLQEGTRTKLKVKMAPPKYCNVTYTWGWRDHPPRAQAVENSHKRIPPGGPELVGLEQTVANDATWPTNFPPFARLRIIDHERFTFAGINAGQNPVPGVTTVDDEVNRYFPERRNGLIKKHGQLSDEELKAKLKEEVFDKLAGVPFFHPIVTDPNHPDYDVEKGPISRIGDLSPAKRMWWSFREMHDIFKDEQATNYADCIKQILDAQNALRDWMDRNHLPSGLRPDPKSDFTILYVNNTIYGESRHGGLNFDEWTTRSQQPDHMHKQPSDMKLTILNGDYFLHGYINPDFGGNRGWENQFKPTLAMGGSGSFFTFGRFNWRFNSEPGAVAIPPAVRVDEQGQDIVDENHPTPGGILSDFEPIYDGSRPAGVRPFAHRVWIRYNFEPSRRLRFYQFDPLHHDAAIFSVH